jgi:hypothetical protein
VYGFRAIDGCRHHAEMLVNSDQARLRSDHASTEHDEMAPRSQSTPRRAGPAETREIAQDGGLGDPDSEDERRGVVGSVDGCNADRQRQRVLARVVAVVDADLLDPVDE